MRVQSAGMGGAQPTSQRLPSAADRASVGTYHGGMRRSFAVAVLMFLALPALAQSVDEIAEAVEFRGYYADPGVDIEINDLEGLVQEYGGIGFVALDDDPSDGADLFAEQVLAAVDDPDTILVLSPSEAGLVTDDVYSSDQIDAALDAAFSTSGDSFLTDFREVAQDLTAGALAGSATTQADSAAPTSLVEGGGGIPWLWIVVVLVVLLIWWMSRRGKRQRAEAAIAQLEAAKAEIKEQMGVVANEILEFSDRVDQDPEAVAHYRRASDVFKAAEDRMEAAETSADLESLSDDLDIARWEMAAADAIVEGREVPPKPEPEKPVPCFFDPTHGAGIEEAELQTAAGTREVTVCKQDAERLRRGDRPEPRSIDVGGRRVPAPQAPRSSGGGGMDWLDAFSILVGGMSRGTDYSWGRGRRRTGGGLGGVLGGMLGGAAASSRRSGRGMPGLPSRRLGRSRSSSGSRRRSTARGRRSR